MNDPAARHKISILLFLALVGVGFSGCVKHPVAVATPRRAPKQDSFVESIAAIKHSIAPVVCVQPHPTANWELFSTEGTAFFVSADGFVTASHVIDGLTSQKRATPCPRFAVYIPESGVWNRELAAGTSRIRFFLFKKEGCKQNVLLDVAYCVLGGGAPALPSGARMPVTPVGFEEDPPPDGTPVAFSGFPLSNVSPITAVGFIGGYTKDAEGRQTIILDRTAWPGASGSPIYLQNGHVIGIVLSRGTGDAIGLAYGRARLQRFVEEFLPKANLPAKQQ
jgi:hypothetical protein